MRWDDPKLQEYFRSAQPVVITGGCPFTRALVGKWNFAHLRAHFGELEGGDGGGLMMHWAPRHERRFSRFYGERLGRGGCAREKSFARFAAAAEANEASANPAYRFYAQASMLWMSDGSTGLQGGGELRVPARVSPAQRIKHAAVGATLVEEMRSLDWEWLARALSATGNEGFHSATLWAGHGGGCTPMHYDAISNFFTQLHGQKQILLFPPGAWPNVYPYPTSHPMSSYAMVDVESPGPLTWID